MKISIFSREKIKVSTRPAGHENIEYLTAPWRHRVLSVTSTNDAELLLTRPQFVYVADITKTVLQINDSDNEIKVKKPQETKRLS